MVSKGDLGVGYLVSVGVVLFGVFSSGIAVPIGLGGSIGSRSLLGLSMGVMVAGSFLATGMGLARSTLDDERVWRVAGWSTLGLGLPTLLIVCLVLLAPSHLQGMGWRSVAIVNIAAGGVVGVLVGSILELRAEHERTRTLNQRNTVFLRLFRHDIRTSLNLIRGHLDLVADGRAAHLGSSDVVYDQLAHIERLSDAANRLDDLESMTETESVDLGAIVADCARAIERETEGLTVETTVGAEAYVQANDLLLSVVDNLLRNAVEHAVDDPRVHVTVETPARRRGDVTLRVRDYGPGFDDAELAVHNGATETALQHSDGVGLWLVRWIVDTYDGTVSVANAADGVGAVVTVTLPAASEPPSERDDTAKRGVGGVRAGADRQTQSPSR